MKPQRKTSNGLVIGNVHMTPKDLPPTWAYSNPNKSTKPKVPNVPPKVPPKVSKVSKVPPKVSKVSKVPPKVSKVSKVSPNVSNVPPKVSKVSPNVSNVPPKVSNVPPKVSSNSEEGSPNYLTKICQDYGSPVKAQMPLVSGYDTN